MNFTKTSDWLRDFKRWYARHGYGYICHRLSYDYDRVSRNKRDDVVLRIDTMLRADCRTEAHTAKINSRGIEGWLRIQGVPDKDLTNGTLREYRLRFIGHLADLYEAEGD